MEDFSLIEKLVTLMNIIMHKPLFLFCSMIGIAVLVLYIINIKKEKNISKWIFICIWIVLLIVLMVNYSDVLFTLLDNFFDDIFEALYFPNLAVYIIIVFVSNFSFFYSMFSKKLYKLVKIINFFETLIVDIFLIIITDIVSNNKISIYDKLTVYSDSNLLVLLQLTSSIFASWILLLLLASARNKLKKYDKKKESKPEIIFEDV